MTPTTAHELRLLNAEKRHAAVAPGPNFDMGTYIGNCPWLMPVERFYDRDEPVSLADCNRVTLATLKFRLTRKGFDTSDVDGVICAMDARFQAALSAAVAEITGKVAL